MKYNHYLFYEENPMALEPKKTPRSATRRKTARFLSQLSINNSWRIIHTSKKGINDIIFVPSKTLLRGR